MDFVTHAAVGALVGRAVAPRGADPVRARRSALVGALVSVAPDADHVLEWVSGEAYLVNHRTATHSVVVLGAAMAAVAVLGGPNRLRRALLGSLALASHLLLDVLTPFGTVLLWPFRPDRYALDVLPIFCPWFTAASLVAAVAAVVAPVRLGRPRAIATVALLALGVFALYEATVAARARDRVAAALASHGGSPLLAVPDWRDPTAAVVFAADPRTDELVRFRVGGSGEPRREAARSRLRRDGVRADDDPDIRAALARPDVARLLSTFRIPVADADGARVVLSDLQFDALEVDARPIVVVVPRGGAPHVVHMAPGVQPLLYLLVIALAWMISRRPFVGR